MKHRTIDVAGILLALCLSVSAGLNYNASKSNTGNIVLAHTSTVSEAQASAVLAELDKSRQTPSESALRNSLTKAGVKQVTKMKIIVESKDGKTIVLLLDDPGDEKNARDVANTAAAQRK